MSLLKHRFDSKKIGFLSGVVLSMILLGANPCYADDWTSMQDANQRAQQASTAANSLCAAQSATRTQVTTLAGQITASYNTFSQRLQDNLINDAQADFQYLNPVFNGAQSRTIQLTQLIAPAQSVTQAIESAPGFSSGSIAADEAVMTAVRQMMDQARAIHDTIQNVIMRDNQPLMNFVPKPSYANWMAIANNKTNPGWYTNRDQRHVALQDALDSVMRKAYAVYGNMPPGDVQPNRIRPAYLGFVDMRTELNQLQSSITQAANTTSEILVAMNAYPGLIRQQRTQLTQEALTRATQMEASLQQAKDACAAATAAAKLDASKFGPTKPTIGQPLPVVKGAQPQTVAASASGTCPPGYRCVECVAIEPKG